MVMLSDFIPQKLDISVLGITMSYLCLLMFIGGVGEFLVVSCGVFFDHLNQLTKVNLYSNHSPLGCPRKLVNGL